MPVHPSVHGGFVPSRDAHVCIVSHAETFRRLQHRTLAAVLVPMAVVVMTHDEGRSLFD